MWKRGTISPLLHIILYSISNFRSQITYSFVKCGCSNYCFPHSLNSDMSRYGYLEVFQWVPWNSRWRGFTKMYANSFLFTLHIRAEIPEQTVYIQINTGAVDKGKLFEIHLALFRHIIKLITKTCLYNFDPLKPHFYIVKLGFIGVYIIFLIFCWKT